MDTSGYIIILELVGTRILGRRCKDSLINHEWLCKNEKIKIEFLGR